MDGGRIKLITALLKHHDYDAGSCLNLEPVGNNELARLAGVSNSTASNFFKEKFGGHKKYRISCVNVNRLATNLRILDDGFQPKELDGVQLRDEWEE
jgi:hypothetical protein